MKTKEEVELLAECEAKKLHDKSKHDDWDIYNQLVYEDAQLIELGYNKCKDDMKKELYEFGKLVLDTFHSEGKTYNGENRLPRIKFDNWFEQTNKD